MTASKNKYFLFLGLLSFSCNGSTQVKIKDFKSTEVKSDKTKNLSTLLDTVGLKVSAYLVYNDSTISTFDVLNDKTIALWNTIIGAGDAERPSVRTKIKLIGKLDSLMVTIYNGKRKVENKKLPNICYDYEFIINNTGCEEVKVIVTKLSKVVYQAKIPFECGE